MSPPPPVAPGGADPGAPRYAAATDIGLVRSNNEDAYLLAPPLFAVADGMGGHRGGEVASEEAIRTLSQEAAHDGDSLVAAVHAANKAVYTRASNSPDLAGMGTTMTAMLATSGSVQIVHVGDSRAYLLRDGRLRRVTQDHTVVDRLAREGKISAAEVGHHPQRSVLERALGVGPDVDVDVQLIDVHPGDRLLLCTDGLSSMISDGEIHSALEEEPDLKKASERLVAEALKAGGKDNVTAVIVDFPGEDGPAPVDPNKTARYPVSSFTTQIPPEGRFGGGPEGRPEGRRRVPPGGGGLLSSPSMAPTAAIPGLARGRGGPPGPGRPAGPSASSKVPPRSRPDPGEQPSARLPRRSAGVRALIWVAVVVPLVVIGLLAGWFGLRSSWYVGVSKGYVAIFQGVPGSFAGIKMSSLASSTSVPTALLPQDYQRRVQQGITASGKQDAERIARNLRQLEASPSPSPVVSPGVAPSGSPSPGAATPGPTP